MFDLMSRLPHTIEAIYPHELVAYSDFSALMNGATMFDFCYVTKATWTWFWWLQRHANATERCVPHCLDVVRAGRGLRDTDQLPAHAKLLSLRSISPSLYGSSEDTILSFYKCIYDERSHSPMPISRNVLPSLLKE